MSAVLIEAVENEAQFGPPVVRVADCSECLDTGVAGGSAWTAGSRCEACRRPGFLTRALRRTPLGPLLAATPRTIPCGR